MKQISFLFAVLFMFVLIGCNNTSDNEEVNTSGINSKPKNKPVKASPAEKAKAKIGEAKISIDYSSPRTKGREIWGKLVEYNQVWRTGADEATIFETDKSLLVEGQELPAGKYAFFTIPGEKEWTVIFNREHKQWGAFNYEEEKDALRVKVKPMTVEESMENMTFLIIESAKGEGEIKLAWEKAKIAVAFKVAS